MLKRLPVFLLLLSFPFLVYSQGVDEPDGLEYYPSLSLNGVPAIIGTNSIAPDRIDYWTISGNFDWIGDSKLHSKINDGRKVGYVEGDIDLSYTHMVNGCEGVTFGIGGSTTHINWQENPFFKEKMYNNLIVTVGAFSKRFECWDWRGSFSISSDCREWNLNEYGLYTTTLWGRYSWDTRFCSDLGLNIGFIDRAGIKNNYLLPIVGVDFRMNRNWKVNVVYPVNVSLVYTLNDAWSVAIVGKKWNSLHRVNKHEVLSKGIFNYRNMGAEFAIFYECTTSVSANIHVGSTFGQGDIKISDKNNRTQRHNKLQSSAYAGGGFTWRF